MRAGDFRITVHCLTEELPDDNFTATDAVSAILTGWIDRDEYDEDLAMEKYVIYDYASDERGLGVVTRFEIKDDGRQVLIITAYEIFFDDDDDEN